jgi:hypothetical protein
VYHSGIGGGRYIDIALKEGNYSVRMEVKSWKKMYPATFIKQLVEKDLANISSLDELRWVFDAKYQGDLKADILKALKSEKGKAALNNLPDTKKELFFSYDKTIGITDKNIERFINLNFSKIIETY